MSIKNLNRFWNWKEYFYSLVAGYYSLYIRPGDKFVEVDPVNSLFRKYFSDEQAFALSMRENNKIEGYESVKPSDIKKLRPEYFVMNGNIHYERDIQTFLETINSLCLPSTRIIISYYSSVWRPLIKLATLFKLRAKVPESNWITHEDISNLLELSGFEPIRRDCRVLFPFWIPFISNFVNRYIAPLPFFRLFTLMNILVARAKISEVSNKKKSVSIVVAARNESGNIENLITRLPKMGPDDELIFIEGNSTDDTWNKIQEMEKKYKRKMNIKIGQQAGKGKGDAVRKGFAMASKDILMILDADLTVPPEDLPKFYKAITHDQGEFINGSRLVYPMEKKAMRFFNIIGNKFFASAFSFVLGQKLKDTLCGTKVLSRENYLKIAGNRNYFGDFDPFGDFDLLFGASRLGLKIKELPVAYKERVYGDTNIQRWTHGVILLRMLLFAARKIKFV